LPLSHIAEQLATIHGPAVSGATVYFAESIDKVAENIREVQPTVFFGVPRIWEKIGAKVADRLDKTEGAKKALVGWVRKVATTVHRDQMAGRSPSLATRAQYAIASRLLLGKLKKALGLGSARLCVSGAAPISAELLEFFTGLDLPIYEIYGQSEDCGPTSFNLPGAVSLGSVGRALPGVEVKIADDEEILVKGRNVFLGYYKEAEATAAVLKDGWLHSGDLGKLDRSGFLHITGRKKDIIITAGGKNIAPKNIESALKNQRLVGEAVVVGDRRPYLTALLTLDEEAIAERPTAHDDPSVKAEIDEAIRRINSDLAQVETIKKYTILPRPFSVEKGELTPTLKVKRAKVNEAFADTIESMYRA